MKALKRTTRKENCKCIEKVWGSDNRYTICNMCGTQRFYPQGWKPQEEKTQP